VSECDLEASEIRPRPTRAVEPWEKKVTYIKQKENKQRFKRKGSSIIAK
jgi:hypothetical protein